MHFSRELIKEVIRIIDPATSEEALKEIQMRSGGRISDSDGISARILAENNARNIAVEIIKEYYKLKEDELNIC